MAYALQRTLILKSKRWHYDKNGWEDLFMPLSKTCTTPDGVSHDDWQNVENDTQVVHISLINGLNPRPPQLPLSIPEDLAPQLKRLHGVPFTWWVGQIFKYLFRFNPETQKFIDDGIKRLGFRAPIVGVQIRRTDKIGTEAKLYPVEEYMKYVDEYYDQLEMVEKVEKRRVFLATDEPKVVGEARSKYPKYEIINNSNATRMANSLTKRDADHVVYGVILDLHLLSMSDHIVCTFTSSICRGAYALMQTRYPDASHRFKSLDNTYYFSGEHLHTRRTVLPHHPKNKEELSMNLNDSIYETVNHLNGFSSGIKTNPNEGGLFPSFKVVDIIQTAVFPTYPDAD